MSSKNKVQAAAEALAVESIFLSTRERKILEAFDAASGGSKKKPAKKKAAKKARARRR